MTVKTAETVAHQTSVFQSSIQPRASGARSALANVNFALGDVSYNPRATARPSNRIMAQDPAAGAVVARGTRIRVQIDGKGD